MKAFEKATKEFENYKEALNERAKTQSFTDLLERECVRYSVYSKILAYLEGIYCDYELKNENQNVLPTVFDDLLEYDEREISINTIEYAIDDFLTEYCIDTEGSDELEPEENHPEIV